MVVADCLKTLRESKNFSQGDIIEERTGLLRCYVSRVENGHTVPSVETVEKFARALEIPLYQLMFDGNEPPAPIKITKPRKAEDERQSSNSRSKLMHQLIPLFKKMSTPDGKLILLFAGKTARG
jgi:transcriptional regulator with XRE-family HTH domain